MANSVKAAEKIFAATYAHNQLYDNQPSNRSSGFQRNDPSAQPVDPYDKSAASGIVALLISAKDMKSSALNVRNPDTSAFHSRSVEVNPDEAGSLKQIKHLISDYNSMLNRVSDMGDYLNPSVKRSLENAAGGHDNIGIAKKADGTLELDEIKFKQSLSSRFEQTSDAVSGTFGLADKLSKAAEQFESLPPLALLNSRMPARGLLFDGMF